MAEPTAISVSTQTESMVFAPISNNFSTEVFPPHTASLTPPPTLRSQCYSPTTMIQPTQEFAESQIYTQIPLSPSQQSQSILAIPEEVTQIISCKVVVFIHHQLNTNFFLIQFLLPQ